MNLDERCEECGQTLPDKPTHVYAVRVKVNSGRLKWFFSETTDEKTANREALELRATGYEVRVFTKHEAKKMKEAMDFLEGKKRRSRK